MFCVVKWNSSWCFLFCVKYDTVSLWLGRFEAQRWLFLAVVPLQMPAPEPICCADASPVQPQRIHAGVPCRNAIFFIVFFLAALTTLQTTKLLTFRPHVLGTPKPCAWSQEHKGSTCSSPRGSRESSRWLRYCSHKTGIVSTALATGFWGQTNEEKHSMKTMKAGWKTGFK